ncbi:sporulation protein [Micromonospora sp. NPDC049559]|uniref:sporulation protein n=1 Tax=Micromonospora sp. NPDC049559 TaxID=3155923 RepID=UPI00342B4C55
MGFGQVPAGSSWTGLAVDTVLPNPSTRPGLALPGRVLVEAGSADVPVGHVVLGLVTRVEPEDPNADRFLLEFHRITASGPFVVPARTRRAVDFAAPLPWETPITVVNGQRLLDLRMGLRTQLALDPDLDQGDLTGLYVHPLPAQELVMGALSTLGFTLRQVGMQAGRLPGVRQALPLHQKIGYWVAPLYAGPITELELTFVTDRSAVEVIFWLDRRMALAGSATHFSLSRFRLPHAEAARADPVKLVDGWLRRALDRHADAAAGYHRSPHPRESVHVSRPPEHQLPHPEPPDDETAGGGSGGGDGT